MMSPASTALALILASTAASPALAWERFNGLSCKTGSSPANGEALETYFKDCGSFYRVLLTDPAQNTTIDVRLASPGENGVRAATVQFVGTAFRVLQGQGTCDQAICRVTSKGEDDEGEALSLVLGFARNGENGVRVTRSIDAQAATVVDLGCQRQAPRFNLCR